MNQKALILPTILSLAWMLPSSGYGSEISSVYGEEITRPALLWTFEPNKLSIDACLLKAYEVMKANTLQDIQIDRDSQLVAGTTNSMAADIRCSEKEWVVIVAGSNYDATKLMRNALRKAMMAAVSNKILKSFDDLTNGNYTVCSQDVVTCFFFRKIGNQIIGSYYFPGTESVICVSGEISNNIVRGEAQGYSVYKKPVEYLTYWDNEKVFNPLRVGQESVIQVVENQATGNEWSYYHKAELNLNDFLLADNEGAGGKNVRSSPPPVSCHPPN